MSTERTEQDIFDMLGRAVRQVNPLNVYIEVAHFPGTEDESEYALGFRNGYYRGHTVGYKDGFADSADYADCPGEDCTIRNLEAEVERLKAAMARVCERYSVWYNEGKTVEAAFQYYDSVAILRQALQGRVEEPKP